MRILINAISTKKQTGGAYQIAFNFLMKTTEHQEVDWAYVVSSDLDETLPESIKKDGNYYVFPTQPDFKCSYKHVVIKLRQLEQKLKPDVIYSITAPSYFSFESKEIMRFTNPWVTHPNKYSWASLSFINRLKKLLYCWNQRRMMRKAFYFVTQTETTKKGIMRITGVPSANVKVVNNVLPQVFRSLSREPIEGDSKWINVACVGVPVSHKNIDIIPDVLKELDASGVGNICFHLTIPNTHASWVTMSNKLKKYGLEEHVVTHGHCSQIELADMYRRCQLCFLPTLLEVFSASSLEAMFFRLPVVATDFDFNREVLEDSCLYYEPMNAKAAAEQIKRYVDDRALQEEMQLRMDKRLELYGDYDKHFNEILSFLQEVAANAL